MKIEVYHIEELMKKVIEFISSVELQEIDYKPSEKKWSKKEILGHLIDSGINNLQRFTEINYEERPLSMRNYRQNDLVIANNYQLADVNELLQFWLSLNKRIIEVIRNYSKETLQYEFLIYDKEKVTVEYWIDDYINHMKHHVNQILN